MAGTLGHGGAERQLFYIASALKSEGTEALVLSLTQGEVWESRLKAIGVPVKFVGASGSRFKRLLAVIRAGGGFRPDIVQSQHFFMNGYGAITARLCRAKAVGAIRSSGVADSRDCGALFGRICLHSPHVLAVNSRAAIRALVARGCPESKLYYLRNVIDFEQFRPASDANGHPPMVLGIGRLGPEKRFDLFLQALTQLNSRFPVRGVIAGDGALRPELEAQASRLGLLPGTVEFLGRVTDASGLYRRASVFVLTSDYEGTPNVVLEAMASGIPVVATRVGDVPDLLGQGERGRLVAPGDLPGLVGAVGDLLGDARTRARLADLAHDYVRSEHSHGALKQQLVKLYSVALAA